MNMEMSARDKKLLIYLVAIVILALAYFFVTKPLLEKNDALTSQADSLQAEVNELTNIYNNQEDYVRRTNEAYEKAKTALTKFPGGLTQENTLMMLQGIEDNTSTWISRVSFSESEYITQGAEGEAAEGEFIEEEANENAGAFTEGEEETSISIADIRTLKQDLALDYSCTYDNFKNFIKYIENYDQRLFISSINARYSPETNEVSGSVTLSQFAIEGAGKKVEAPDLSGLSLGVDNIFTTLSGTTGSNVLELGELNSDESEDGEEGEEDEDGEADEESEE